MYIPFVMLGSVVMLAVALITNNIQRQYPNYWWTAAELPSRLRYEQRREEQAATEPYDLEKTRSGESTSTGRTTLRMSSGPEDLAGRSREIVITEDELVVPDALRVDLTDEEARILQELQMRLRTGIPSQEVQVANEEAHIE